MEERVACEPAFEREAAPPVAAVIAPFEFLTTRSRSAIERGEASTPCWPVPRARDMQQKPRTARDDDAIPRESSLVRGVLPW
jgi:hypothetical protein